MDLILYPLLLRSIAPAQGARVFIVTDLEGAGGVNDRSEQLLPGQCRYAESRHRRSRDNGF
jgi:hypothetical protein